MLGKLSGIYVTLALAFISSCKSTGGLKSVSYAANPIADSVLESAHVGVCVYDPSTNQFLYNYQGDKFFVPASNTKLFSLYAGLKYLGDSLIGALIFPTDTAVLVIPTGDPTLLHPDFGRQPLIDYLKTMTKPIYLVDNDWRDEALGAGWSWDDYNGYYMPERSALPVYGNVIRFVQVKQPKEENALGNANSVSTYSIPEINWKVQFRSDSGSKNFSVQRDWKENIFYLTQGKEEYQTQDVPFITDGIKSAAELLADTLGKPVGILHMTDKGWIAPGRIFSQPVDSLFVPMMHRSDNFFAEQTLLMISAKRFGVMSDDKIIDTLLKADLTGLPQKPVWADGSGLSRFDLFSPEDMVWLLNKMQNEFGLDRMKKILPTGGTGTLGNRYKSQSGHIYAKTGSLSGVVALSGYLITQKNRLLIFSILVNNSTANGGAVRDAIEKFVTGIIQQN